MTRTRRRKLTFSRPFTLRGIGRALPAGEYELVTDEELIEELSFPAYRRTASWIMAPAEGAIGTTEMIPIDPVDFAAALEHDGAFKTLDALK
jgi:hypothetical protein